MNNSACYVCSETILVDTEDWFHCLCPECFFALGAPENEPDIDYVGALQKLLKQRSKDDEYED